LHLAQHVHLLPWPPAIEEALRVGTYGIAVALNALAMECWQEQAPMLLVEFAINGKQSVTSES
jgi:hypothetical protein